MKTALATAERLLGSIEQLVAGEGIWLGAGNCARAAAVSRRVSPLIARLYELSASDPALRATIGPRVASVLAQRRQNHALLVSRRAFVAAEARRIAETRQRLSHVAPVYGRIRSAAPKKSRLNAAV